MDRPPRGRLTTGQLQVQKQIPFGEDKQAEMLLLEDGCQLGKPAEFEQLLAGCGAVYDLVLKHPGKVVRNEDGMQARCKCRVDVGLGTVANHPGCGGVAGVMFAERTVGVFVLLGQDLYGSEEIAEAGAGELAGLLVRIAFRDHDAALAGSELGQRFADAREQFDLLVGDGVGEADDALVFLVRYRFGGELLETADKGLAKAFETVAMCGDGGVFDLVQMATYLFRRIDAMVQIGDKTGNRPFEVDVVLPQRVISVEEESLAGRKLGKAVRLGAHSNIIKAEVEVQDRPFERTVAGGARARGLHAIIGVDRYMLG